MSPMTFMCIAKLAMDLAVLLTGTLEDQLACSCIRERDAMHGRGIFPDLVENPRVRVETENFLPEKLMMGD